MRSRLLWKKQQLPNGLRVITYPKPSSLTVQLAVAVEYGANDDPDNEAGAAHFLEHMIPGGSTKRIGLSREFERLGGLSNFFTNPEYTLCIVDVVQSKLLHASSALSQLLSADCFEEEQFRAEKKIIIHELAEIEDDPREKVNEMLRQNLFRQHPIRRSTGGTKKTVGELQLQRLTEIHKQRYVPQNMILIMSGNFTQNELKTAIEYASFPCKPAPKREKRSPETTKPTRISKKQKAGLSQTYISLGARTADSCNPDVAALDVLNVVLGVGTSSRLFVELREKRALSYSIVSSQTDGLDFGYFSVDCAVKPNQCENAEKIVLDELSKLRDEDISPEELSKGKDMILGDAFRGVDDTEVCPEIIAVMEMQFGSETALVDYVQRVNLVSAEDVRTVANKYLRESQLATAILFPKS